MADNLTLEIGNNTNHPMPCELVSKAGIPEGNMSASLTMGPNNFMLLEDTAIIEMITNFTHAKVVERSVHAKGIGAHGVFIVTHDNSKYCSAPLLSQVGLKCDVFARFSTIGGESGSSDTLRDNHGLAFKLYTLDGNVDFLSTSLPVFPIRDGMKFASFNRSQNRHPETHLLNPNTQWDFISLNEETIHAILRLFSHFGIPDGYEHMDGFLCHAFKLYRDDGQYVYAKFKFETNQGEKFLTPDEAVRLSGADPDYFNRKLINLIKQRKFPSWTLKMQVITQEQADQFDFFYSDITLVWDDKIPWIPVGNLTLNAIPENYFEYTEQVGFCVGNLPKYIEGNQDKVFNLRTYAYGDAQRYRTGVNSTQLKVNSPLKPVNNYQRNGIMCRGNQGSAPNYYPNSYGGPQPNPTYNHPALKACDEIKRYETTTGHQITQSRTFYHSLNKKEKDSLSLNLAKSINGIREDIKDRTLKLLTKVDTELGNSVAKDIAKLALTPE